MPGHDQVDTADGESSSRGADLGTLQTGKLTRQNLGSQIADSLRANILFGRIAPGTRLAQQQLCELFGTSRMPVRDALRQLVYEGFVRSDDSNGAVVTRFRRSDLEDVYELEGILHGRATRRATERATPEEIRALRELDRKMSIAEHAGEPSLMGELNWRFHRSINVMARSPKLLATIRTLSLNVVRDYLVEIPAWMSRANSEHESVLKAMESGDAATAEALMIDHVREAGFHLIDYLAASGLDLET